MANVELDIVFLDENAGQGPQQPGGPGVSQAPRVGAPQGFAATAAAATATATVAAAAAARAAVGASGGGQGGNQSLPVIDGGSGQIIPYGGGPRQRGGVLDVTRPQQIYTGGGSAQAVSPLVSGLANLAANVGLVTAAFKGLMTALEISTNNIRGESQAKTQMIMGDVTGAAITRAQTRAANKRAVDPGLTGVLAAGAIGTAAGGPLVGLAAALSTALVSAILKMSAASDEKQAAKIQAFENELKAFSARAQFYGQYNGALAGQLAQNQAAQIGRDIGAANILGPGLTELEKARREYDTERDVAAVLTQLKDLPGQQKRLEDLTEKMRQENNEGRSKLNATQQKMLDEMRKAQKTAIDKILDDIEIPDDPRGMNYGMRRDRDRQMNRPALNG
jgi:tetrahydromethanopterin S-methyltransferase subunit G